MIFKSFFNKTKNWARIFFDKVEGRPKGHVWVKSGPCMIYHSGMVGVYDVFMCTRCFTIISKSQSNWVKCDTFLSSAPKLLIISEKPNQIMDCDKQVMLDIMDEAIG